jgi:hypothetical protein
MSLAPLHREDLTRSGLTDGTIELMGVRAVPRSLIDKLKPGGFPGVESVLEFPYQALNGNDPFSRYKLFPPLRTKDNHTMKYFQRAGTGCRLYVLEPLLKVLPDPRVPLILIEGEKKAALAVQWKYMAIGISGVWSWSEGGEAIDDFNHISFVDREVEIVFDSDIWVDDRIDLQRALFALGKEIEGRGAKVTLAVIPGELDKKVGFDDFVVAHGIEAFKKLNRISLKHTVMKRHQSWWDEREKKRKTETANDSLQGKALELTDPEPWPEPVDGAELLNNIAAVFRRFIVLPLHAEIVQALW